MVFLSFSLAFLLVGVLAQQQGLFAPRALPRFTATAGPSATLSPSTAFPVSPVIQFSAPWFFSTGRGGLLQLLDVSLSSCNWRRDRKSTRLNSSHTVISYAVFCLKKKKVQDRPKLEDGLGELLVREHPIHRYELCERLAERVRRNVRQDDAGLLAAARQQSQPPRL